MSKPTFREIIEILEAVQSDCVCDAKSDWIESDEKMNTIIDINLLNSIIGHMKRIAENPKSRVFHNIKLGCDKF